MKRPQREFTICTPWRRHKLTTKSDKGRGWKGCALNNITRQVSNITLSQHSKIPERVTEGPS